MIKYGEQVIYQVWHGLSHGRWCPGHRNIIPEVPRVRLDRTLGTTVAAQCLVLKQLLEELVVVVGF